MKKNNNNNLIDNIEESDFEDSIKKESSSFNTTRDISSNSINKPWYKKKGTIIGISSTLGAGILTTAIAVPLVLTSTQNTAELSKVITVYDSAKKTAKLIVEGKNLPNDKALYSVFRETTAKALTEIETTTITLKFISATEINLDFADSTITTGTTKPMYQVKLNNGTTSGSTIVSKPEETLPQPTFTITTQPSNVTLSPSATQNATFTVIPSDITNPISGANLSYQWKTSDTNTTTDESKWTVIPNETKASYTYDAKDLTIGTKKYFTCTVSYKYANSITTTPASVVRVTGPSINISAQTQNVNLAYTTADSTTTLSVTAEIVNGTAGKGLTYQWKTSGTENGEFSNIQSATTNTYELSGITAGSKKYYKCTISYDGIAPVDSTPIFVAKDAKPTIKITSDLASTINLTHAQTSTTLSITAAINNPVSGGETLTYQWQESTTNTDTDFQDISNQTSNTYELTNVAFGFDKYYRCKISANSADVVISAKAHVTRVAQPTFTIAQPTTQILTSASSSFTLDATATVASGIPNQEPTYQWKSSTSETGTYENIVDATSATYTKELDANTKNSLRDTWYKCEVTYTGAVTPTILSNPALVKMTLTAAEARVEFIKWSSVTTNYEPIIKTYFNTISSSNALHLYYTSLHDHTFKIGSEPKSVEVVSVAQDTLTVEGDTNGLKTYKIRLKTLGDSIYTSKTGADTTTEKTLPTGSFIEFYTLFSFQGNNIILRNTTGTNNYNMDLSLTFTETSTAFTTTVKWTSTTVEADAPSVTNPLKKGAYPVKFYGADGTTEIFADSLYLPMRPVDDAFISSNTNPAIPAYHIKLNH